MELTQKQIKELRKLAHHKKVIVMIGQHGLTDAVMNEIDQALEAHELIKVKVNADDREQRRQMIRLIAQQTQSQVIQAIGHVAVFYRQTDIA